MYGGPLNMGLNYMSPLILGFLLLNMLQNYMISAGG